LGNYLIPGDAEPTAAELAALPYNLGQRTRGNALIERQRNMLRNSPFNPFGTGATNLPNPAFDPGRPETASGGSNPRFVTNPKALNELGYRLAQELGNRRFFNDFDYYRYVLGMNGDFSFTGNDFLSQLGYDTGVLYERTDQLTIFRDDATRSRIYQEIIAGNFDPFLGIDTPATGVATTFVNGVPSGTVPYDNAAAAARASYTGHSFFYSRDFLTDAKIFGNLFPQLYQGGIDFNVGFEYRQSRTRDIPDPVQVAGDQLGFNPGPLTKYKQEATSVFGEVRIPLALAAMNIPGLRSLEVAAALRYEEFDDKDQLRKRTASFDNGGTPRFSIRYQPSADVTLRASYGQSFLSPSPQQLFGPRITVFSLLLDPLTGRRDTPRDGVLRGGNPQLQPEKTDAYSAGIVVTPRFLPGFTATVDFYQLYTTDLILDSPSVAQILLTANGNSGGTAFSDLVIRETPNTFPTQITAINANASKRLVNGMDLTAAYAIPLHDWGTFTISTGYNYFFTWKAEPVATAGSTNFLGDYTRGSLPLTPGAIPYHKGFLRGEWAWKGFDFVSTVNYINSFNDDSALLAKAHIIGGTPTFPQYDIYRRVSDYITLDMQLSYEFKKPAQSENANFLKRMLEETRLTAGVNNAFDRTPPTVLGAFNDNYDTSLYSIRNRYYYVAINKKF
jgi:outer membrane receptor protein involved in Fe transport